MSVVEADTRTELEATLAARRELGPEHDDALIQSFLERLVRGMQAREQGRTVDPAAAEEEKGMQFVVALVSLGVAIPITGIVMAHGLAALAIAWLGIVLVNVAFARAGR